MQSVQIEKYNDSNDFFEMFEGDTFDSEDNLCINGKQIMWLGFVDGNVCAGYDYKSKFGWTVL